MASVFSLLELVFVLRINSLAKLVLRSELLLSNFPKFSPLLGKYGRQCIITYFSCEDTHVSENFLNLTKSVPNPKFCPNQLILMLGGRKKSLKMVSNGKLWSTKALCLQLIMSHCLRISISNIMAKK